MSAHDPLAVPGRAPDYRGKVRDLYDLGERLLLVASDRLSAFDVVLPDPIPDKGAILTRLTEHWLRVLGDRAPNHLISTRAQDLPAPFQEAARAWGPRFMLVHKLEMLPVECVVRGYLAGSGWKEYCARGSVCGIELPSGLELCSELPEPIFTPTTKATEGHDEPISRAQAAAIVGAARIDELERRSLEIYRFGRDYARERGILLADTKFEFGVLPGTDTIVLADEVLTPDSSRFWPADRYRPGANPPSFDKQFVRDHLTSIGWDHNPPAPPLPADVVAGTSARYREIYERLTGVRW
ncbi:MAG: phosphoribosylaminoimidazolesuccinocarboxamide synthase [Planctomycetota bacterium]